MRASRRCNASYAPTHSRIRSAHAVAMPMPFSAGAQVVTAVQQSPPAAASSCRQPLTHAKRQRGSRARGRKRWHGGSSVWGVAQEEALGGRMQLEGEGEATKRRPFQRAEARSACSTQKGSVRSATANMSATQQEVLLLPTVRTAPSMVSPAHAVAHSVAVVHAARYAGRRRRNG